MHWAVYVCIEFVDGIDCSCVRWLCRRSAAITGATSQCERWWQSNTRSDCADRYLFFWSVLKWNLLHGLFVDLAGCVSAFQQTLCMCWILLGTICHEIMSVTLFTLNKPHKGFGLSSAWFICWIPHYINCLFAYLICLLTFFLSHLLL